MACRRCSSDYARCERLFTGSNFQIKTTIETVPMIDLQEWKDMQKVMYELQRQSIEIKRTQQDISSLKKQLSEL